MHADLTPRHLYTHCIGLCFFSAIQFPLKIFSLTMCTCQLLHVILRQNSEGGAGRYDACRSAVKQKRNEGGRRSSSVHREMKQRHCCSSLLRHALLLLLRLVFLAALLLNAGGLLLLVGGSNAVLHKSMGESNGGRVTPPSPNASRDPHT